MSPAANVFPEAFCSIRGKKFLKFARKSHVERMLLTAR
jgi:hypothetical protein